MAWTVEFEEGAEKDLDKIGSEAKRRILKFLNDRIRTAENPRSIGEALHGSKLGAFWKYRVGDYRIICNIDDMIVTVYVVRVGHRREVYR
jgi:mRNA interferase RelE/StbE